MRELILNHHACKCRTIKKHFHNFCVIERNSTMLNGINNIGYAQTRHVNPPLVKRDRTQKIIACKTGLQFQSFFCRKPQMRLAIFERDKSVIGFKKSLSGFKDNTCSQSAFFRISVDRIQKWNAK